MRLNRLGLVVLFAAGLGSLLFACGRRDQGPAPTSSPASPAAARKVFLEVDQMAGTPRLELERSIGGRTVSLKQIYAEAGLELELRRDQGDLPRKDAVSLAELHALMAAFRSLPAPADAMRIHLLVATAERDDPDTLGVMFDFGEEDADGLPREGFAVFADSHQGLGSGDGLDELLLTTAHELAHCFNLHHPDWEGQQFRSGSTIESYSLANTVQWKLSGVSKSHLGGDPGQEVWPGRGSLAFGLITSRHLQRHQRTPLESFDVLEDGDVPAARRGTHVHSGAALRDARDRSRVHAPESRALKLRLETPKRAYQVGEPIVLTIGLHNEGTRPKQVLPLLAPEYQFLAIELRAPGAARFDAFRPAVLAEARGARARVLAPGESLHEEAKVFFGSEGWTFQQPGTWTIRADFPAGADGEAVYDESEGRIQSAPLEVEVVAPRTASERRVKERILGHQQGIFLLLGGGDHLKKASAELKAIAREAPTAAQAPAVNLALGMAALNPTIDPATKVESRPRLDEARQRLQTTLAAPLPALTVAQTQAKLAHELEKAGKAEDAKQVRRAVRRTLAGKEAARETLAKIEREQR